jgi:hypothetical protein
LHLLKVLPLFSSLFLPLLAHTGFHLLLILCCLKLGLDVLVNQDRVLAELINVAFVGHLEFTFPLLNILLVLCDFGFALTFDCLEELSTLRRLHQFLHLIYLLPSLVYAHLVFLRPIKQVFRQDASLVQFAKLEDLLSQLVSRFCDNFVYFFCLLVPQ